MTEESIKQTLAMLRVNEGYRTSPYRDTQKILTIGYGHNMEANPLPPDIKMYLNTNGYITKEMAETLLKAGLDTAIAGCKKLYPAFETFPESVQIALADIMYNMGYAKIKKQFVQTVAHINAQEWDHVQEHLQDSLWYRQVGDRAKRDLKLLEV